MNCHRSTGGFFLASVGLFQLFQQIPNTYIRAPTVPKPPLLPSKAKKESPQILLEHLEHLEQANGGLGLKRSRSVPEGAFVPVEISMDDHGLPKSWQMFQKGRFCSSNGNFLWNASGTDLHLHGMAWTMGQQY